MLRETCLELAAENESFYELERLACLGSRPDDPEFARAVTAKAIDARWGQGAGLGQVSSGTSIQVPRSCERRESSASWTPLAPSRRE
jgi:hypothetical protein